jgi:hypothetical protein
LLFITLPGFIILSTYLDIGIPEIFYLSMAFWSFRMALDRPERTRLWVTSGLMLGLAFITRETAASMGLFIGMLFLFKPIVSRARYFILFGSFIATIAADWLYLTLMTHNPVHRYSIDLNHDKIDRFSQAAHVMKRGGLIDSEGAISINVFLDPILNLFISQKYTILFWLLVPAVIYLWKKHRTEKSLLTLDLLAGFALVSFIFVGANPKLYLVPRYFLSTAWAGSIIVAWWLFALWRAHKRAAVGIILGITIAINAVALSVENTVPRFVERQLAGWVAEHPGERVYTDVETFEKSRYFFKFGNLSIDQVSVEKPPIGATFFFSKERVQLCKTTARCRDNAKYYEPEKSWQVEKVIDPKPQLAGSLLHALGFEKMLPYDIAHRLMSPGGNVIVYKVGKPVLADSIDAGKAL